MRIHTYTLPKRIIAMLLSIVMMLSVMPALQFAASAQEPGVNHAQTVADNITMDTWAEAFLPGGLPSTDYAGAIWTDKSVFTQSSLAGYTRLTGNGVSLKNENNFMVALSALATNSVVVGQDSAPVDAVLVLDVSASMSSQELTGMVEAANNAIRMLLEANEKSRVSVVIFDTNATALLPLDRYTGATNNTYTTPTFLTYYDGAIYPGAGYSSRTYSNNKFVGVTDSSGVQMERSDSVSTGQATYMQRGLWAALQQLLASDAGYIKENNSVPAIILMGDGAPSYSTPSFDNVSGGTTYGGGGTSSIDEGGGFATQLTAAYVKAKVAEKYGKCLMYSVGFGLSNASGKAIATKVLNPGTAHTAMDRMWQTYNNLAVGETMQQTLCNAGTATIKKSATVLNPVYMDGFYEAEDAASLITAFQNVVNQISLQTGYYPTRTDDNGANFSGYITFADTLGAGMEVTQVEGILVGDTLFTGIHLAQLLYNTDKWTQWMTANGKGVADVEEEFWLGTQDEPTELGDKFVRSVKARMGIYVAPTDESAEAKEVARKAENDIAWELIRNAWANKQLGYEADSAGNITSFSNYIGWYGDANGNYVAPYPYGGSDAAILEKIAAKELYVNFDYGALGSAEVSGRETNMMYVTVRLSKNLKTGERMVIFQIPAELVPTLTYSINLKLGADGNPDPNNATISVNDVSPIVLVYEVGVDSTIVNDVTIHQVGTKITDPNDPDYGKYYLYASSWDAETNKANLHSTLDHSMSYAHFEPSPENEHYFFPADTALVTADGTAYKGSTHPMDATVDLYFEDTVYSTDGTPDAEDPTAYTATVTVKKVKMAKADLSNAVQASDGSWYMPEGAMFANAYAYDLAKTATPGVTGATNITGTHDYTHYHVVNGSTNSTATDSYELMYQGNNGRMVYAPSQGIALTKEVAPDAVNIANNTFQFTVTILGDEDGSVDVIRQAEVDGEITQGTPEPTALVENKLNLTLKAGETVWIIGIEGADGAANPTFTVTEEDSYVFKPAITVGGVSATAATGQVEDYEIVNVVFTNDEIEYGSFTITKTVNYNNGTSYQANGLKPFDVVITLDGYAHKNILINGAAETTDGSGQVTVQIKDGETITVSQVPVGTDYTVTELTADLPDGYAAVVSTGSGTVVSPAVGVSPRIALVNSYTPTPVYPHPQFEITGTKTVNGSDGTALSTDYWPEVDFTIRLQQWNFTAQAWEDIPSGTEPDTTVTVNKSNTTYSIPFQQEYTEAGTYRYRILEDTGTAANVAYDQVRHSFEVIVTDDNLDGILEIRETNVVDDMSTLTVTPVQGVENAWAVEADFTNVYAPNAVTWTPYAEKILTVPAGASRTLQAGEFRFVLTGLNGAPMPAGADANNSVTMANAQDGKIYFDIIAYDETDKGHTYAYTLTEVSGSVAGVTYDLAEYRITVTVSEDPQNPGELMREISVTKGTQPHTGTITFTNSYELQPAVTETITATKTLYNQTPGALGYMNMTAGQFRFTLTALEGAPLPGNVASMELQNAAGGGQTGAAVTVPQLTFTQAGVYRYTLQEQDLGASGYTYDATKIYTITVTVTDNLQGQLVATTAITLNNAPVTTGMVFANTYRAQPTAAVNLGGKKTLTLAEGKNLVRALQAGEFSFTITGNGVNETKTNDAAGNFAFTALTFDRAGQYTYTISEVKGSKGGVTYATNTHTLVITVSDNGAGQLMATAELNGQPVGIDAIALDFTNTYDVQDGTLHMTAHKVLEGQVLSAGQFRFTLTGANGSTPMPSGAVNGVLSVRNYASGLVDFGTITYTAAGIYEYTVTEEDEGLGGITYDANRYTVRVTVTDNGLGALVAAYTVSGSLGGSTLNFRNEYKASSVTVSDIIANKTLTNLTPGADPVNMAVNAGDFSFKLTAIGSAPMPTGVTGSEHTFENGAGGVITVPAITYSSVGTYQYTLEEVAGTAPGYSYSTLKYTITVHVTDNGVGQLVATKSYALGDDAQTAMTFANTYLASPTDPVVLTGTKHLEGRPEEYPLKAGEFSFTLTAKNGAPMPTGFTTAQTVVNEASGSFTFGQIVFDAAGVYTYTVTEEGGTVGGVQYDQAEHTVTITVTDIGGKLNAQITGGAPTDLVFTNTYSASPVDVYVTGDKTLVNITGGGNADMDFAAGDFSFKITGPNVDETVDVKDDGSFSFTKLHFTSTGIYTFLISEVAGSKTYIDYDNTVYTVVITVTDDGEGNLEASATVNTAAVAIDQIDLSFRNTYLAEDTEEVILSGNKNLVDITGGGSVAMTPKDGDFSFVLKDSTGTPKETVQNVGGVFTFTGLTFDSAGVYTYTVSEVEGNLGGIHYDKTVHTVTITVTDNGQGKLIAAVQKPTLVFENEYKAEAATDVVIQAEKELLDITGGGSAAMTPKDGDFSFILKDSTGAPVETVSNKGKNVAFTGLDYDKPGVYTYTITEVKGELTGVTYSEASIGVTVTVTDDGQGQLKAAIAYANNSNKITNTFKGEDAILNLAGKKTLDGGRKLKAEEFSFNLKGEGVDETVKNAADGTFQFTELRYDTVGIYTYEITEIKGSDAQVKYDETKYTVTVTVTYENGEMKAAATVGGQPKTSYGFTNIFTPKDLTVELHVQKVLQGTAGTDLTPAGFQFQLIDTDKIATSDAQGDAKFTFVYTSADIGNTYTYKFSEVKGNVAGMTYDTSVQEIKVTISQDSTTGELKYTVEGQAVFTNIYEQPPKTADNFNMNGWILMMSISAVGLMAVIVLGKKKLAV